MVITEVGQALALFSPTVFLYIAFGCVAGTIVAIIPGLGGLFVLALLLPFTYALDPMPALAMLLSAMAVTGTANTVTGVLFGVPGNAGGVATIFDGYPMARRGEANRAMSAGFFASLVGGILGVVMVMMLLPFVRPLVILFGPPEFFVLVLAAIVLMAHTVRQNALKAVASGGIGLMVSFVGLERSTSTARYTFDSLYLWDGLQLIPLIIGLFALAEMMLLLGQGKPRLNETVLADSSGGTARGIKDVFLHPVTTVQSSAIGAGVGMLPGLGGETAQFIAYSQAARRSPRGKHFGTGEVEGVIASDACTNSKDAASLVPTLLFGIPGSAPMALLLAAFMIFGVRPGPSMLDENLDTTLFLLLSIVAANIFAACLCIFLARRFAKLALLDPVYLAPVIMVVCLFGAYTTSNHVGDVMVALTFGVVGYFMATQGFSRATFLIGLVLGPLLEHNYLLSLRIHGFVFLLRPLVVGLTVVMLLVIVWPITPWSKDRRRKRAEVKGDARSIGVSESDSDDHPRIGE